MENRYVDNADFFMVSNEKDFYTNDAIYQFLLNEYPSWLENPKVKDLIENKYIKQNQNQENNNQERKKLFGLF